jgi:hypothetical protein
LFASVPPDVKKISAGLAAMSLAMFLLLFSTAALAVLPSACVEDGLPKFSFKKGNIASKTSSEIVLVAAFSS